MAASPPPPKRARVDEYFQKSDVRPPQDTQPAAPAPPPAQKPPLDRRVAEFVKKPRGIWRHNYPLKHHDMVALLEHARANKEVEIVNLDDRVFEVVMAHAARDKTVDNAELFRLAEHDAFPPDFVCEIVKGVLNEATLSPEVWAGIVKVASRGIKFDK